MTEMPPRAATPAIERASPADRAVLAIDGGSVPEQLAVILRLGTAAELDVDAVRTLIAERIVAVPRLRQRLIRLPARCGGPIWIDDEDFDIARHFRGVTCPRPGDERALLDLALAVIVTPLRRDAPLWSATFVTGLADGAVALVLVLHHALADGIGGLSVLASLIDLASPGPRMHPGFPRPRPAWSSLAADSLRGKLRALRHGARSLQLLRRSVGAGGGLRPPRAAACSLNQPTGPRRSLVVVRADLNALREAAHQRGATVNAAILVAIAGALHRILAGRGESVSTIVLAVPVSGRQPGRDPALGNMVSPIVVRVPATGDRAARLEQVAADVRAHKAAATGPPPIALLGWLFRRLAALGGYRWYMNRQRRVHSLVSYVRGPAEQVHFAGYPVLSAIPVSVSQSGNLTVLFEALSYAGTLTVTAITDPDHFPDAGLLTSALAAELELMTSVTRAGRPDSAYPRPGRRTPELPR